MSSRAHKGRKGKRARGKTIDSWKSKEWYEVFAPKAFKEAFLGEIPSSTPDSLVGRTIEILLYDLTKNFKHTTIKLKFKIVEVQGKRCNTVFFGHELTRDFVRSLIHRGSSRVDGIFNYTTADGVVYRVSTFVVTRRRAKKSQKLTIRKIIHDVLQEFAKNMTHEKFIQGVIYGKFALNIKKIAKTIYPLRECQIRKVKVISIPEGVTDQIEVSDQEEFDEVELELKEHGKTVKAKKHQKHHEHEAEEGEMGEGVADSEASEAVDPSESAEASENNNSSNSEESNE
ncbi:30S ribosomal protein S3ae [Candidatus Harpocratesius sp.]